MKKNTRLKNFRIPNGISFGREVGNTCESENRFCVLGPVMQIHDH